MDSFAASVRFNSKLKVAPKFETEGFLKSAQRRDVKAAVD